MTQIVDDGNNGHGNDEDGVDDSNPGNGGGNNGNQGGNGNHYGWTTGKYKTTLGNDVSNMVVMDINGKETNIENALPGYYFLVNNGIIVRKIYKN
jgi:hypothetical protein